jgi:hypothetical protein
MQAKKKTSTEVKSGLNRLTVIDWIKWLAATLVAGITITAYVHVNFATASQINALEKIRDKYYDLIITRLEDFTERLDRVEDKLDRLIEDK